jgi:ribulose-phosphate 3-epimerase
MAMPHVASALLERQVVPSILSADFARLGEQVEAVMGAGARMLQVDVMDGQFVPELTIGPLVVQALRDLVHDRGGLLDCHLMVERPERQIASFAAAGADVITVHAEATPNVHYALQQIRASGCAAGVAINPGTAVEAVAPTAELLDLCLCMTVNPGWGGQAYIGTSTEKIRRLRALLPPRVALQVDGGISLATIGDAARAGANLHVAGSSVFGAADPGAAYAALAAELERVDR